MSLWEWWVGSSYDVCFNKLHDAMAWRGSNQIGDMLFAKYDRCIDAVDQQAAFTLVMVGVFLAGMIGPVWYEHGVGLIAPFHWVARKSRTVLGAGSPSKTTNDING
jgi:hypothetical protein